MIVRVETFAIYTDRLNAFIIKTLTFIQAINQHPLTTNFSTIIGYQYILITMSSSYDKDRSMKRSFFTTS